MVTLIGNYLSPYVRKVLVCLDLKAIPYEIDPIIPFFGNDEFTRLNPDRRVPVLIEGDLVLTESSVICEFLDESYPGIPLQPAGGFLFGELGIADIAVASMFRNAAFAQFNIDAARWPRASRFVGQTLEHPSFVNLRPFEEVMLRTPIARHRTALIAAGAPVSDSTLGGEKPRKGPLSV
jgi:glutathione S-transferase